MRIAVRGVVVMNGKLLLMHRIKNGEEYWVVPGGGVEGDESYEETVVREMEEEAGITVKPVRELVRVKFGAQQESDNTLIINLPGWEAMDIFYLCEYVNGKIGSGLGIEFAERSNQNNIYEIQLVSAEKLEGINIRPKEIRSMLLNLL